jgi:hypothetical protein
LRQSSEVVDARNKCGHDGIPGASRCFNKQKRTGVAAGASMTRA